MSKRFISIWFCYLKTDWYSRRQPHLCQVPLVVASPDHGRMIVAAANAIAQMQGINVGMAIADSRAIIPSLEVMDDQPELPSKLLKGIAEWCIRYTPVAAIDLPDGLMLEVTGCTHLWGGEKQYLADIIKRLHHYGYEVRTAMADTIGAAWAMAHFGQNATITGCGQQAKALLQLPPAALRLETETVERLEKLGLRQISRFINMPQVSLRRRFGTSLLLRLNQALGYEEEAMIPVQPIEPYGERLPCLEPIVTPKGIEMALQQLLDTLCCRLKKEQKGLRAASFMAYRVDGKIEQIDIGTNRPSHNSAHLFKLFQIKIESIEPALGIELFILSASKVEEVVTSQEKLWENAGGLDDISLAELLDRITAKIGVNLVHRYLPDEHYWPERSFKAAAAFDEKLTTTWKVDQPRPLQLLYKPEPVEVTAPIPDYPPMLFRYRGKLHKIAKADGPERIEAEWWLEEGQHRDYYCIEDEEGHRYWLFRLGHYDVAQSYQWFIHGFFP